MKEKNIKSQEKVPYKISPKGSLGLLALGDLGLEAWRKVKKEYSKKESNK